MLANLTLPAALLELKAWADIVVTEIISGGDMTLHADSFRLKHVSPFDNLILGHVSPPGSSHRVERVQASGKVSVSDLSDPTRLLFNLSTFLLVLKRF